MILAPYCFRFVGLLHPTAHQKLKYLSMKLNPWSKLLSLSHQPWTPPSNSCVHWTADCGAWYTFCHHHLQNFSEELLFLYCNFIFGILFMRQPVSIRFCFFSKACINASLILRTLQFFSDIRAISAHSQKRI